MSYSCILRRSVVDYHNVIARSCPNLTSLTFIGDYENQQHLDQANIYFLKNKFVRFSWEICCSLFSRAVLWSRSILNRLWLQLVKMAAPVLALAL